MCEILAPAGDKNSAIAAINAGADAIYLGLKQFSARSSAENFNYAELEEILKLCRLFGIKVYVAMNTLIKDDELEGFLKSIVDVWNLGCNAIIISDIFVGKYIKSVCPQIKIHLSTQAGVCNRYGAAFAKKCGFDRVILARETPLADIAEITKIIETEVFVQGALCTCFSGQCYLSSFAGGNSGNRGKCKQPCRKQYTLDRRGLEGAAYRISLSDLSVGEDIAKLKEAGVSSFKIEGRMRRPEYVSAAVKYYKNILCESASAEDLSALKRTYNRGNYTKGLIFGQDKNFISSAVQGHIGEYCGTVKVQSGKYILQTAQKFSKGDGFKILRDGKEICGAVVEGEVRGGVTLAAKRLKNGDKAFITTDNALNERLLSAKRLKKIEISARFLDGQKATVNINGINFVDENILEKAQNQPLTAQNIENRFKKVDKYPFDVVFKNIETDGVFMAASALNAFRRSAYETYFNSVTKNLNKSADYIQLPPSVEVESNHKTAAICTDLRGITADIGILKADFNADFKELTRGFSGEKYLFLPPYLTADEIDKIKPATALFDGIYCAGVYGFELCEELKKPLFAGTGLNISNRIGAKTSCKYVALSKELTTDEAQKISLNNSFYLTCGALKVMDLIYCPFEKKCASCDKRRLYSLTDDSGRIFTLRRYVTGECRFELYNCVPLAANVKYTGKLLDCTLENRAQSLIEIADNSDAVRSYFKGNYTRGHSDRPVL